MKHQLRKRVKGHEKACNPFKCAIDCKDFALVPPEIKYSVEIMYFDNQ